MSKEHNVIQQREQKHGSTEILPKCYACELSCFSHVCTL